MLRLLKYTWIPVIIALVIFYLCCIIQPSSIPDVDFAIVPFDKAAHFCMYLGFSGATALYYVYDKKGLSINMPLIFIGAVIVPIVYGGLIEIVQDRYFPPREGDWLDFLADVLGTLAAIPLMLYLRTCTLKANRKK